MFLFSTLVFQVYQVYQDTTTPHARLRLPDELYKLYELDELF
jgi:hypothetical protein